jgi:dCTP deaminase
MSMKMSLSFPCPKAIGTLSFGHLWRIKLKYPWQEWIPGVLNKSQTRQLCEEGLITVDGALDSILDHSSIDLSLSDQAFRMTKGSVKPSHLHPYQWFLHKKRGLAEQLSPVDGIYELRSRETYVFKLRERLEKELVEAGIYGQATAKSSIGRVDVLARLIVDGMDTYESFDPEGLEQRSGEMYLEITPTTFNVKVKPGISLSQLRLFYGKPTNAEMRGKELFKTLLHGSGADDGSLSVDVTSTKIGGLSVGAICAKPAPLEAIPLWKEKEETKRPDPCKYWRFVKADESSRLKIEETNFYLIRSKERISVPKGVAIYCRASDETIGEMRIHYAGFVHPFFGRRRTDGEIGTPLMFEVRGHQVHVSLADGEKMANLTFYRMSQDCEDDDAAEESYETQTLEVSKFFRKWPDKLKGNDDGSVEAV